MTYPLEPQGWVDCRGCGRKIVYYGLYGDWCGICLSRGDQIAASGMDARRRGILPAGRRADRPPSSKRDG